MLNKPLEKIVFLDIETTTQYEKFEQLPEPMKRVFKKRFQKEIQERSSEILMSDLSNPRSAVEEVYDIQGPLFAELNKIICITIGVIDTRNPEQYQLITKSFVNENEKALLQEFIAIASISKFNNPAKDNFFFCAHNGMIFDFPVIAKRLIYNGIDLPAVFDFAEKKPWDIEHFIDTKNIWKFGVFDGNVSLDMLAAAFGVESSKMIMSGEDVKDVYYIGKGLNKIVDYCEHDVFALASIYLKMKNIQVPLVLKGKSK